MMKNRNSLIFAIILAIIGVVLESLNVGTNYFLGFTSVGQWMVYVGIIGIAIVIIRNISKKERKIDERMYHVASKANRITFLVIILTSFLIMIIDGISTITLPYSLFMSYYICGIVLTYLVSYKLLLKQN